MTKLKTFPLLAGFVGALFFAVNQCTQLASCALIFTILIMVTNLMGSLYGFKNTILVSFLAMLLNIISLSSFDYMLNGQIFTNLVAVSLIALFCSASMALFVVNSCADKAAISTNLLALMAGALIDALFMSVYFANYLTLTNIAYTAFTEIMFKLFYGATILAMVNIANMLVVLKKKSDSKLR